MSNYSLWDIQSSSILLETQELSVIAESAAAYVLDNGEDALDDLLLGIEPDDATIAREHTGRDILSALKHEQTINRSA